MDQRIDKEECTKSLPHFLVVGTARAGTTSVYRYLKYHPEIYMPEVKEPGYFRVQNLRPEESELKANKISDLADYLALFSEAKPDQIFGDCSPMYLYEHQRVIQEVDRLYKDETEPKIIIVLRDPIDRLISQYSHNLNAGFEQLSLEEALRREEERIREGEPPRLHYKNVGLFYDQVRDYLERFQEVRIFLFKDLTDNSDHFVKDLYDFLGVNSSFQHPDLHRRYNVSGSLRGATGRGIFKILTHSYNPFKHLAKFLLPEQVVRSTRRTLHSLTHEKPELPEPLHASLRDRYREDVQNLELLIERSLQHWLK